MIKTMQLKKEIDFIIESKLNQDGGSGSSEESNESLNYGHQEGHLSPGSLEKIRNEKRYLKKYKRAFDTVIERVENQSSSGNNSGDERHNKLALNNKKRKLNEYLQKPAESSLYQSSNK